MKTKLSLLLAGLLLGGAAAGWAMDSAAASVRFHEPDKFTDFRLTFHGGEREIRFLKKEFSGEIERLAHLHLPPGYKLNVVFSDIALAGDFEPQLGPDFDHVRVVKDIYPPRMQLAYEVLDENGNVVQKGDTTLTDLAFLQKIRRPGYQQFEHEFDLLERFIRDLGHSLS